MPMTLDEYIANPLGKKSAVMSAAMREVTRTQYTSKFDNVLLRENGKINYYTYRDAKNNTYYIHVKVPSETVEKFYYDVVFKFFTDSSVLGGGINLGKWYVQFYSNDPAFVYTYANVFARNKLLVNELASKMSTQALKTKPAEKNPDDLQYYSKIIYFAILFLKQRKLLNTALLSGAEAYDQRIMLSRVEHADKKIEQRQVKGKEINKKKKIMVSNDVADTLNNLGVTKNKAAASRLVTTTNKVKTVKATKALNRSKVIKKKK